MDPISQASLGAAAAALFSKRENIRLAVIVGAVAGAAPDLDIFIRSETDPLLSLQYHRHFTHAIVMAPVIGLIVAGLFKLLFWWKKWPFKMLATFAIAGAVTHGLLDACTSYGTLLYWPFTDTRESWDIISIIDPIFTIPLFLLTVIAFAFRRPRFAQVAIALCALYFSFGIIQRERAQQHTRDLAASRGHTANKLTARPSIANTLLWRTVYEHDGRYYVDAVWTFPLIEPVTYEGDSVATFGESEAGQLVPGQSVTARDIERFRHFSQGYLYQSLENPLLIGDLRYSLLPDSVTPLWAIKVDPEEPHEHIEMRTFRRTNDSAKDRLWAMIRGQELPQ